MSWEKKLSTWIATVRNQVELPLRLELWNGKQLDFCADAPRVTIRVPGVSALSCLLTPSLANIGSAYVEGEIDIEGKTVDIMSIIGALVNKSLKPVGKYSRLVRSLFHDKQNDADAIRYHYDVSNEFYKQWLDDNMVYSCAYFENGDEDLHCAQLKKIDHILNKIQVRPGDRLLDIGCGWGALAMRAAEKFGARCVGITLSENQYALAKERVAQAGLGERVEIRLQDYRDVKGSFERITSVGMFEHVGLLHLPEYFAKINSLLTVDGIAMNHGITTSDPNNGEAPYGGGYFIEKYVFPQGELAHIGQVLKSMQEGGLEALDIENLRHHYAKTCTHWIEAFEHKSDVIRQLTDEKRYRIWRVYLVGSAYAFAQDWISLYQIVCGKAGRNTPILPLSRGYMYPQM